MILAEKWPSWLFGPEFWAPCQDKIGGRFSSGIAKRDSCAEAGTREVTGWTAPADPARDPSPGEKIW